MVRAGGSSFIKAATRACRTRWPAARFRQAGDVLKWVDGPARLDVFDHLSATGIDRARLERCGVRLERRLSRPVLAAVVLAAMELHGQDTGGAPAGRAERLAGWLVDDLRRFPLPDDGPLQLPGLSTAPEVLWRRAKALASLLPTTRPVVLDRPASWRPVVRRLGTLAAMSGIEPLDRVGELPRRLSSRDGTHGLIEVGIDGPHPLTVPLRFAAWPDQPFLAVTDLAEPFGSSPPLPRLRWEDGPSPRQVEDLVATEGLPHPLGRCDEVVTGRVLSRTAVAASVLLYRRMHREPYRDDAAGYHWMARWKSERVRRIDRRWRFARERLAHIQNAMLELPLPLTGELPSGLGYAIDGGQVWSAAETLLALATSPGGSQGRSTDPTVARASFAVDLARTLEEVGDEVLDLLVTNGH